MRIACLYVPDFSLAALRRADPDVCGAAVAVADGAGPRATLVAVSAAAARHGVTPGLTAAQATALCADVLIRPLPADVMHAAQAALCDAAESLSPRIEDAGRGIVYLDLHGLGSLFSSEAQLATALSQRALSLGLDACVGVAGSKIAARLAAQHGGGVAVIAPGEEWQTVAPLPVGVLRPSAALAVTLRRWGLRTIGDLARLPAAAIAARLGPEGVALVRRARGEDDMPLLPRVLPPHFEEGVDLDYGIDMLEPLAFVARGLLERLTARLALRGFICGDLRLSLGLATRGRDERTVVVAAPSNDVKALLTLLRLQLEARPPAAAVDGIRIGAVAERLRAAQLDLFCPPGPAPARLAATVARLTALCGADRVGTPALADSHRPEAFDVAPIDHAVLNAPHSGLSARDAIANQCTISGLDPRSDPTGSRSVERTGCAAVGTAWAAIPVAVRAMRPAQPVEVFCTRDRPEFVRGSDFSGRVVQAAGPWRVHGEWWHDGAYARDYYDAQLSDGCVYRLFCDLRTRGWFVDGVYD